MKIVIVGGRDEADFLIGTFLAKKHKLIVINEDLEYCKYLSDTHNVPVYNGDPSKSYVLNEAEIADSDVLIALCPNDYDNLIICQYAKQVYNVQKAICTVKNPKNVDVFKRLGINSVLSATHMVAQYITQASLVENLVNTLSINDNQVLINEIIIESSYACVGKTLKDITFPNNVIVGCIFRKSQMIVPNGEAVLQANDKIVLITSPENQEKAFAAIKG